MGVELGPAGRALGYAAAALAAFALLLFLRARFLDPFTVEQAVPVTAADGSAYRVHGGHPEPRRAADTLAAIHAKLVELLRHLRRRAAAAQPDTFAGALPFTRARRRAVERLLARYDPDAIVENSPHDPANDTAYVVGKGRVLALCIRSRRGIGGAAYRPTIHDLDILTFVAIHELSHMAIDAVDHPPEFWSAFSYLLREAEAAGVFVSPDYAARPVEYCGLRVNYSPRWDPNCIPL